jgi:two-component system invasion response regulator UvrY
MKNILLADDHSIVRMGVRTLLQKGLPEYIVDEAEDEKEIETRVKEKKYQLIILDIDIPQGDFVKLMHWLLTVTPDTTY